MDERIRQAEARVEQKLSLEEKDLFDRRQKLLADMEGIRLREFELNSQRELLDRSATVTNFIYKEIMYECLKTEYTCFVNLE